KDKMADAKSFKVFYFDIDGRAEVLRLILTYAGKEFEDVRLSMDKWLELKPTTPFGQVPVLEIDGKKKAQSIALAAFLAREFKLYGKDNWDALTIDTVAQLAEDLIQSYFRFLRESDPVKKEAILTEVKTEVGPKFLGFFESLLKENGTGFFVGNDITLADIIIYDIATGFLKVTFEAIDNFPLVKKLVDTVGDNERIKKYVSDRK
ncbi:glutathione S-transferase 7, partial [Biomphalaria glabrata]